MVKQALTFIKPPTSPLTFNMTVNYFPVPCLGKPEKYADFFSLNRTTAKLMLLKPLNRDLYQRFDLVIKVIRIKLCSPACCLRDKIMVFHSE